MPFAVLLTTQSPGGTLFAVWQHSGPNETDVALRTVMIETVPDSAPGSATFRHVPTLVADAFRFVQEDAGRRRNAPGIMSGARSCLDVALKGLGQTTGGRRERINNLATAGLLTASIAAWAQELWEEGSDATHDLQADMDRAIEHVDFLRLFFEVAFELPAKIAAQPHAPVLPPPPAELA